MKCLSEAVGHVAQHCRLGVIWFFLALPSRSIVILLPLMALGNLFNCGRTVFAASDSFMMQCYECSGAADAGCTNADMDKLSKYRVNCTRGTHECFKIITPHTHVVQRSCGIDPTTDNVDVALKDGCLDIPALGYVCSCSSRPLCNAATTTFRSRHSLPVFTGSNRVTKPIFLIFSNLLHSILNIGWIMSFFLLGAALRILL